MAKKYGLNAYTVQEGMNAQIGQAGFKELTAAGNTGDGNFCAFLITGEAATDHAVVAATCHTGDNMTACKFRVGQIVYGAFNKITVTSPSDADVHVLCYYG